MFTLFQSLFFKFNLAPLLLIRAMNASQICYEEEDDDDDVDMFVY